MVSGPFSVFLLLLFCYPGMGIRVTGEYDSLSFGDCLSFPSYELYSSSACLPDRCQGPLNSKYSGARCVPNFPMIESAVNFATQEYFSDANCSMLTALVLRSTVSCYSVSDSSSTCNSTHVSISLHSDRSCFSDRIIASQTFPTNVCLRTLSNQYDRQDSYVRFSCGTRPRQVTSTPSSGTGNPINIWQAILLAVFLVLWIE